MLEGWNRWEEGTTAHERGQLDLYLDNKGWGELPERFTDNEDRVRQFNYTPQQKRGGKIPSNVLETEEVRLDRQLTVFL